VMWDTFLLEPDLLNVQGVAEAPMVMLQD